VKRVRIVAFRDCLTGEHCGLWMPQGSLLATLRFLLGRRQRWWQ
jgi:hypothetical protein